MRFEYTCRYCKQAIGVVEHDMWTVADGMQTLGLNQLDRAHQQEVIDSDGVGTVRVQAVCDSCEQAVRMHPELLVEGSIIQ